MEKGAWGLRHAHPHVKAKEKGKAAKEAGAARGVGGKPGEW